MTTAVLEAATPPAMATGETPARALRRALGQYPTGVTIVTAFAADGRPVGLTVNSFASLSLEPPLLLWSLANTSPSRQVFRGATHFAVNVLADGQAALAMRFADPRIPDKFAGVALVDEATTAPLIAGALATFVCACRDALVAGDHTLFIGAIESHASTRGEALVFHRGRFAALAPADTTSPAALGARP